MIWPFEARNEPTQAGVRARRRWIGAFVALIALVGGAVKLWLLDRTLGGLFSLEPGAMKYTVDERLAQFEARVRERLAPSFAAAGVPLPPKQLMLVAFKDRRQLEMYARAGDRDSWTFVKRYAVLGASGLLGPKLAEGDRQVPEGVYRAEALNPNSKYHLSIRLDYPNPFDRRVGALDGRTNLGSDIMIHGGTASVGCLAMGDEVAEELFVLAALTGIAGVQIVVSPTDFRDPVALAPDLPMPWASQLYADLRAQLAQLPSGPAAASAAD